MSINSQRGTSLLEGLIALVLVSILVKGVMHLTTRATAVHTEQQLLTIALTQMRAGLTQPNICTTPPVIELPGNVSIQAEVFQGCSTTTVSILDTEINNIPTPVALSVNHELLGGEVVVGGTRSTH